MGGHKNVMDKDSVTVILILKLSEAEKTLQIDQTIIKNKFDLFIHQSEEFITITF